MRTPVMALVTLSLVGCQTARIGQVKTSVKTPDVIVVDNVFEGQNEQEAADFAQDHCQQYGKTAQFELYSAGGNFSRYQYVI